jgi:hypothetical protein
MARTPKFAVIPEPPLEDLNFALFETLTALKQNIELLTGQRNEIDSASRAIVPSTVTVADPGTPKYTGTTASGIRFTVNGVQVPSYADYMNLLTDVRNLGNDVAELRLLLSTLITQLKG